MEKLNKTQINEKLKKIDQWSILDKALHKKYTANSFMEVMSFANLIADRCEQINHHSKIVIDYNKIEFFIYTHSVDGITMLDIDLAFFIEDVYNELYRND